MLQRRFKDCFGELRAKLPEKVRASSTEGTFAIGYDRDIPQPKSNLGRFPEEKRSKPKSGAVKLHSGRSASRLEPQNPAWLRGCTRFDGKRPRPV